VTWIVLATGMVTFLTALIGFVVSLRKIQAVHVLVNAQLHDVLARVAQLTGTLEDAGVAVPPKPGAGEGLRATGETPAV
jgi:hypothetical protein